jgi:hypothetical protein
MDTPLIYYINLAFSWLLVLLSIWGYATVLRKTGQRLSYWLFFGLGWMLIGFSHIFTLGGVSSSEWYMITLRTAGYVSMVLSVISLMIHIVDKDST